MKRKFIFVVSLVLVITLSIFAVRALILPNDPSEIISVTKVGGTSNTTHHLDAREVHLNNESVDSLGYDASDYIGVVNLDIEPGYYLADFTATHSEVDHPLMLGFDAGAETGNFFRESPYRADRTEYQFVIPEAASTSKKVEVTYTVAEKKPIDIVYYNYTSNDNSTDAIKDPNNYDMENEHVLVSGYKDGDLVLTNDCMEKGCALKFTFTSKEDFDEYKSHKILEDNENWIWADGFLFDDRDQVTDRTLIAENDACVEDDVNNEYYCSMIVTKNFSEVGSAPLTIGYTKMNIFAPGVTALRVRLDIDNFSDTLHEKGQEVLTFTDSDREADLEVFYGTRRIFLEQVTPKTVISTGEKHLGSLKDFDGFTGSGYAYSSVYEGLMKTAIININSYYQDKLTLEFNLTKNNENILGGKAKINLDRFAFGGNGGQLLLVDSMGRNCREGNNGNTCDQGEYYSTQYRGIYSFMYVTEHDQENPDTIDTFYDDFNSNGDNLVLQSVGPLTDAFKRNKDFDPHAVALYYDSNDEIVFTRDFELNAETYKGGLITKETFNELYGNVTINGDTDTIDKDYVRIDRYDQPLVKYIEYFTGNLSESIMHNLVLISKDEAEEKDIKKIALFLVNGKIEDDDIPELTYGLGEGRIMEIRGEN